MKEISTAVPRDRAISVHPQFVSKRLGEAAWLSRRQEFDRLVIASDCNLVSSMPLPIRRPLPGTLLGRGQVHEIAAQVECHEADVVFVDHLLTPVQQRNLEKATEAKVVDRTGLILEIFASRAHTKEGELQVELASLSYQVSRLVRSWTHLERQRGGFGFLGGPGERQIEIDRRLIRDRIRQLEKELARVRRRRSTQRVGRKRKAIPTVALVGYTNAGKSTLFNRLTRSNVYTADKLFATLDPTLRLLEFRGGGRLMLSDTVGFVQELPHELVDAFRATLEEVIEADLILHVRDAADPQVIEQGIVVTETLAQIGLDGCAAPPVIEVWNKTDLAPDVKSRILPEIAASRVAMSALDGTGVDDLLGLLGTWYEHGLIEMDLRLDHGDGKSLAFCHEHGRVISKQADEGSLRLRVRLSARDAAMFCLRDGIHCLTGGSRK